MHKDTNTKRTRVYFSMVRKHIMYEELFVLDYAALCCIMHAFPAKCFS